MYINSIYMSYMASRTEILSSCFRLKKSSSNHLLLYDISISMFTNTYSTPYDLGKMSYWVKESKTKQTVIHFYFQSKYLLHNQMQFVITKLDAQLRELGLSRIIKLQHFCLWTLPGFHMFMILHWTRKLVWGIEIWRSTLCLTL